MYIILCLYIVIPSLACVLYVHVYDMMGLYFRLKISSRKSINAKFLPSSIPSNVHNIYKKDLKEAWKTLPRKKAYKLNVNIIHALSSCSKTKKCREMNEDAKPYELEVVYKALFEIPSHGRTTIQKKFITLFFRRIWFLSTSSFSGF